MTITTTAEELRADRELVLEAVKCDVSRSDLALA